MDKLKENKKIATATHNIIAYRYLSLKLLVTIRPHQLTLFHLNFHPNRIDCNNGGFITGCHDDGETHASSRMLHLLDVR